MIQTILFDFDGTLFDTGEGILRSVQYALEGFSIHETDMARLRKFVGPPLFDSFTELYAMTPEQAQAAVLADKGGETAHAFRGVAADFSHAVKQFHYFIVAVVIHIVLPFEKS